MGNTIFAGTAPVLPTHVCGTNYLYLEWDAFCSSQEGSRRRRDWTGDTIFAGTAPVFRRQL